MVRKFQKRRYVMAAALTGIIFVLGLLLGLVIEFQRIGFVQQNKEIQDLDYESLQIQYMYIDLLGQEKNCQAMIQTFDKSVNSLEATRNRIEQYSQGSMINKNDFDILQKEYSLAQIRYWLLARKTKSLCNTNIATILYFFGPDEICSKCNEQAFVLTYLKKRLKDNLLNFVLRGDQEEPMVTILKANYNITQYPTLIIGEKKFEGFISRSDILAEVCSISSAHIDDCKPYLN